MPRAPRVQKPLARKKLVAIVKLRRSGMSPRLIAKRTGERVEVVRAVLEHIES